MNDYENKIGSYLFPRRKMLSAAAMLGFAVSFRASSLFAASNKNAKSIRVSANGEGSRFVIDLPFEPDYAAFLLDNPRRLVLDIPNLDFSKVADKLPKPSAGIGEIRLGEARAGVARVVLDLIEPSIVKKVFVLPPQSGFDWRFVVDLVKVSPEEFAEKVGASHTIASKSGSPLNAETKKIANNAKDEEEIEKSPLNKEVTNISRQIVVVLDPGHGGRDPGAIGVSGVLEKEITLSTALELKKLLEKNKRYKVVLTRSKDQTLSLARRVEIAREAKGDLFISLHADSIGRSSVKGLSVYTLSETASDKEAAALAIRENKADIIAGIDLGNELPEVANFLIDLTRRETMNLSAEFASILVNEMVKSFDILRNTHRFAGFAVLKSPDVPSVLMEMGYLSNPVEEKLLRQPKYRARLASATLRAMDSYFNSPQRASLF